MSTLLKHGGDALPVTWRESAVSPSQEPQRDPELISLEQEVSQLRCLLAESAEKRAKAINVARAQAYRDAEAEHKRTDADALDVLRKGVADAIGELKGRVLKEQTLALLLARVALERVFGETPDFQDLIARAIRHQITALRRESILSVRVSAKDFTDESALAAIAAAIGREHVNIVQDPALAGGDCRIDLRLGQIELSIPEHWQILQDELRRLAAASEAR